MTPPLTLQSALGRSPTDAVRMMQFRLDDEATRDVEASASFHFTDTGHTATLRIRRGVVEFRPTASDDGMQLRLTTLTWARLQVGELTVAEAVRNGNILTESPASVAEKFFSWFDQLG